MESYSILGTIVSPNKILLKLSCHEEETVLFAIYPDFGSIPHPVMGTTRDYCRYIKALIIP